MCAGLAFTRLCHPVGRQGLQRKAHRKRIGASEDLERKARFAALAAKALKRLLRA
jgi:hypothetical protein